MVLCFDEVVNIKKWNTEDISWKNAYDFWNRRIDISNYYGWYEDVLRITRGYPNIHFRHVVAPTTQVPSSGIVPIFATTEQLKTEMDIGYKDGYRVIRYVQENDSMSSKKLLL